MIKKTLLSIVAMILALLALFYVVGKGWFGGPWDSKPVATGPRPEPQSHGGVRSPENESLPLFGDLHVHTNHSIDAYVFRKKAYPATQIWVSGWHYSKWP